MMKFDELKKRLQLVCLSRQTNEDINFIVRAFCAECQNQLPLLTNFVPGIYYLKSGQKHLTDTSIDLIARFFARNEYGEYIILIKYFKPHIIKSDEEFKKEFLKILRKIIKIELIENYQKSDPVGKVFYRSIRYILEHNPQWQKLSICAEGKSIGKLTHKNGFASVKEIERVYWCCKDKLHTRRLNSVLHELIEVQGYHVPILFLLTVFNDTIRNAEKVTHQYNNENYDQLFIEDAIRNTVNKVDHTILKKYQSKDKLTFDERIGILNATTKLLEDIVFTGRNEPYYLYLENSMKSPLTKTIYHSQYKKYFEYIIKKTRKIFSATVEMGS